MNLVSCEECGVVLDKDRLIFPDTRDHDSMEVIAENVEWNRDEFDYVAILPCPVCGKNIRK